MEYFKSAYSRHIHLIITMETASEKTYTWTQTVDSLTIIVPMKRVPASKVDVYLSETFVKINATPIKLVVALDMFKPIAYQSPKNRVQMRDDGLELYLLKAAQEDWPQLCYVDTKENLKKRREESMAKEKKEAEEKLKIAEKKKADMDQLALNEHLALTEAERKHIYSRKEEEKYKAEQDLYETLEKIEAPKKTLIEEVTEIKSKAASGALEVPSRPNMDIFTDADAKAIQTIVPSAKIREKATIKLGFTEKKYPLLAARETQLKEPPLPRTAIQQKENKNEPLSFEEKNPLWLKEKGDNFFSNGDFVSALNAYTKSLEGNPSFFKCYLNRATCYLKVRAYKNCISDCEKIEELVEKQKKEDDPEFYEKLIMRSYVKKAAALCWMGRFDDALAYYDKALGFSSRMTDSEAETLKKDVEKIRNRSESLKKKEQADSLLQEAKLLEALDAYKAILEEDAENEYVYANMSLAYLKLGNYEQCIECCDKALKFVRTFQKDTYSFESEHRLEVKLLLRRARSYDALKKYAEAKADLDFCVMYEPDNADAANLLKSVQQNLNTILLKEAKEAGQKLQMEHKFAEALEKYEECLKITKRESTLDNISIYVNKIACLLSLGKHEKAIQNSDTAVRMLQNYKNKLISNGTAEERSDREKLRQMEIRLYMRRANAYANLQKITQAIDAAKKALELDPDNEIIKADIRKLESAQLLLNIINKNQCLLVYQYCFHVIIHQLWTEVPCQRYFEGQYSLACF
eukprot:TRINITY_DN105134_c2_g1_i1.p2 TRINITY_DN105134_c2_g1~~TRINITY_DN105134_c2_g1_i1.p2  ORF type:complete len:748 (+),score=145.54 TRINITY_DN105134_c2_g1_i1:9608-11851(+)